MTKEQNRIIQKRYREKHKEKIKVTAKLSRQKHREKNREKEAQRTKSYSLKNKEKIKLRRKQYLMSNRPKYRSSYLKRKYNITLDDYNRMVNEQNNLCKVCGKPGDESNKNSVLHIDHCHSTGRVRGLLCDNCNRALGMVKEDIVILEALINYIKENNKPCQ